MNECFVSKTYEKETIISRKNRFVHYNRPVFVFYMIRDNHILMLHIIIGRDIIIVLL